MNELSAANPACSECGAPMAPTAPRGLCSRCLVLNALALSPSGRTEEFALRSLDELRVAFPDFELRRLIGRGGMGAVYEASQESLRRIVALKLLPPELLRSEDFFDRFQREARVMAQMDHPNIARVYGSGITDEGEVYMVLELVAGQPIDFYVSAHKLSLRSRLDLFVQVCAGVQHAHQKGIIHRDLKPSNILVTELDGRPVPKLIDFGLAKPIGQSGFDEAQWLSARHAIGTPAYMSPEQVSGEGIDSRSDIYSLGVLLYQLLTGSTPFAENVINRATGTVVREIILTTRIIKPSEWLEQTNRSMKDGLDSIPVTADDLRGDLDAIVLKAVDKIPAQRYQSAAALPEDIQRHLNHEPVTAIATSRGYTFRKFCRRHRVGLGIVTAFVVLLLVGAGMVLRQTFLIRRAERLANERLLKGEHLIEFMLGDLQDKLQTVGRLDIMEGTIREIERFYAGSSLSKLPPESLYHRGQALMRLGQIRNTQGQSAAARKHYLESIHILEEALAARPEETAWMEDLGQTWNSLAVFHHGRTEIREANRAYREALRFADRLLRLEPGRAASLDFKASVLHNFASLLEMSGNLDEAELKYSQALNIWEPLQKISPDNEQLLDHVSQLYQSLAFVQNRRGKVEEVNRSNAKALALRQRLAELDPKNMRTLDLLADIEQNIAESHFRQEELAQAEDWMNRYRPIREKLAIQDPSNIQWQQKHAEAWQNYALLEAQRGNLDAAAGAHRKAWQAWEKFLPPNATGLERKPLLDELRAAAELFSILAQRENDQGHLLEARQHRETVAELHAKIAAGTANQAPAQ